MKYLSVCSGIEAASVAWHDLGWTPLAFSEIEDFPRAVLSHHYPHVPLHGDFTTLRDEPWIVDADILVGGTPCFGAGTFVTTPQGLTAIEDILPGDFVLTHKLRWRRVLRVGQKIAPTVVVKGQGHTGIVTTAEHPFYACTKQSRSTKIGGKPVRQTWIEGPEWVEARNLAGRHWSSVARFPSSHVPIEAPIGREEPMPEITADLMWLAGAYLGDGWPRVNGRRGSVVYGVNDAKADAIQRKAESVGVATTVTMERTTTRVVIARRALARWLSRHFGSGASSKRVPGWALGMPHELRRALLDGYIAMDGTPSASIRGWRCVTVSRELAFGIGMLANSLGHASSKQYVVNRRDQCVIEGRLVNEQPYWAVTVSNSDRSSFEKDGLRFGRVRSVVETGRAEPVFNLEVEDDNSYVADGLVVHNCQAFSVAGLRQSLSDDRGNLTLEFVRLANAIDDLRRDAGREPAYILWENVPGVLSVSDNAFGAFLAGLCGCDAALVSPNDYGWSDAGVVAGPKRWAAWRILDAQYHGLAQRRRRVFVLSCGGAGAWRCADALLPIVESVRWNPPPRRQAGQGTAPTLAARTRGGGGLGTDAELDGALIPAVSTPLLAKGNDSFDDTLQTYVAFGGNNTTGSINAAAALNAKGGAGRMDFEAETLVAHALRADGFDASEDGTGRGTPLVPVPAVAGAMPACGGTERKHGQGWGQQEWESGYAIPVAVPIQEVNKRTGVSSTDLRAGDGIGEVGDPMYTLGTDSRHGVAIGEAVPILANGNEGANGAGIGLAGDPAFTLQAGVQQAIGFQTRGSNLDVDDHVTGTIGSNADRASGSAPCIAFSAKDHGADAMNDLSPTLRAGGFDKSHANAGVMPAIAFRADDYESGSFSETDRSDPITTSADRSRAAPLALSSWRVRRLTPTECERLQGFPDGYTAITYRGKPAADGPRYKALGNSMAVNVMRWIGRRIKMVEKIK